MIEEEWVFEINGSNTELSYNLLWTTKRVWREDRSSSHLSIRGFAAEQELGRRRLKIPPGVLKRLRRAVGEDIEKCLMTLNAAEARTAPLLPPAPTAEARAASNQTAVNEQSSLRQKRPPAVFINADDSITH